MTITREDHGRSGRLPVAILILFLIAGLFPAGSALHVDGIKILMDVEPGGTYTYPMGVAIGPDEPGTDIAVEVMGFGQSPDGSYVQIPAAEDTGSWSARDLIEIEAPLIHLAPGGNRSFNATIRVPADAPPGGRYATIYVHPVVQPGGTGAGVTTAVLVPVLLTIRGPALTETASITGVQLEGDPTFARVILKNSGNHHFYGAVAKVTVTDDAGNAVASGSSKPSVWALVPGRVMGLRVPLSPALPQGTYTVKADVYNGEGGALLDTRTVTASPAGQPVPMAPARMTTAAAAATQPGGTVPSSVPWPGALLTVTAVSAAVLLWLPRGRR